ncbi:hypothetical protein MBLNU457_5718t1 [Dothideomycetes sp. NU457]
MKQLGLDASLETTYTALLSAGIVLASIALALRFYTRIHIDKQFTLDDWFLIPAQILNIASAVVWMVVSKPQRDICYAALDGSNARCAMLYMQILTTCIYAKLCLKCALALFLVKLVQKTWQRYVVYAAVSLYTTVIVSASILIFVRCGLDINSIHLGITKVTDVKQAESALIITAAAINSASNWVFAMIAVLIILGRKHMNPDLLVRTSLSPLIALAILASILSVYRMPVASRASGLSQYDSDLHDRCMVLSLVETALGIMAVSLTSVSPLLKFWGAFALDLFPKRTSSDLESARANRSIGSSIISDKFRPKVSYREVQSEATALRRLGILPDVSSESLVLVEEIEVCPPPVSWDEAYNKMAMPTITESITGEDDIK